MLPITTHRSFHVPHTLAVAAALVAMIAAFGWNASDPASTTGSETERGIEIVVDTGTGREEGHEHASASTPTRSGNCSTDGGCLRDQAWLPLALPALPAR